MDRKIANGLISKDVKELSIIRILMFTFFFLFFFNILYALINPEFGYYSLYDHLFRGRNRFPFGENPGLAYNFSLNNIDAMVESHEIEAIVPGEEYSIFIFGDSSVWGTLLTNEESLSGQLNQMGINLPKNGLPVRFYNLGYPTISVTKDLLLIEEALFQYSPDMVIWLMTLESLPWHHQLRSPLVQNNPERLRELVEWYHLPYDLNSSEIKYESFWEKTIIGQRRELADLIRLQVYGIMWDATGIDQYYPQAYTPAQRNYDQDVSYYDFEVNNLKTDNLAFEVVNVANSICEDKTEILIINEPIMISSGENSDIRYNFYYPRWAYDQYRTLMFDAASAGDWQYYDLWDIVPENEFTNSAIHLTPVGEKTLATAIKDILVHEKGLVVLP